MSDFIIYIASGITLVVNHHGDKPILSAGRLKLQVNDKEEMHFTGFHFSNSLELKQIFK